MSTALAGTDNISDVLVQPDGKIICVGDADTPALRKEIALLRLNSNGSKDNSFGVLGEVRQDVNNRDDLVFGAALDSFGRILVCGLAVDLLNPDNIGDGFIARFDSDGDLDGGFDGDGLLVYSSPQEQSISSVYVQTDGHIVAAGSIVDPVQGRMPVLRRLLSNGQPDLTLAGDGIYIGPPTDSGGVATEVNGAIFLRSSDKIFRLNVQPSITDFKLLFETAPQRLQVKFNDDVGDSLTDFDLTIRNTTTNTNFNLGTYPLASYDHSANTATFTLNNLLADANYTATFTKSGIENRQNMNLVGDNVEDFFFLTGDADHDRDVDVNDLGILASNWQQSPRTYSQGNFDYSPDGLVAVNDLGLLASHWQQTLAPPSAPFSAPVQPSRTIKRMATEVL
jgi:uncharacterized delta-60 repeat protein